MFRAPQEGVERGPTQSVTLFRVGGVEIAIDYSWFIVFLLVLWSLAAGYFPTRYPGMGWTLYLVVGLVATLLFFSSVLVHELAHAFVSNAIGHEVRRITLFIFGGMAHLSGEPDSPAAEFKIAAVGPLTSLGLAALFWGTGVLLESAGSAGLWPGLFGYLAFINLALAIFNLLPGYPLDGGRLARAFFWHRSGDLDAATMRAGNWGAGIALGLMVLGAMQIFAGALLGGLWLIFIGMFLRAAATMGARGQILDRALAEVPATEVMIRDPVTVPADAPVAEAIDRFFLVHGYGGFPVADNGDVRGVLSLAQVRDCPLEERRTRTAGDVMRPLSDEICVEPTTSLADVLARLSRLDAGRLLVMEHGRLQGMVTRDGVVRFVQLTSNPKGLGV